jgi:hypothetical protein
MLEALAQFSIFTGTTNYVAMRLPVSVGLVLCMLLLWLTGATFTPAEEKGGVLALSVAE